jgi:anti-sigma regulatory factor (Ser/Thr protein kinase)
MTAVRNDYVHEAAYYASDEEFLAVVAPFLLEGLACGEPAMVALGERNAALVLAALPSGTPVEFLPGAEMYERPAVAIRSYRQRMSRFVAYGADRVRVVGELAPSAFGATWDGWARYESAVNHAYGELPMWSMCAYDTRATPEPVLRDVARTHPQVALPDGRHVPVGDYTDPLVFLSEPRPVVPDPVQLTGPVADLEDPTPAEGRRAVRAAPRGTLPDDVIDDLVVAVSEAVTNAVLYGRPPTRMRVWSGRDRLIVTVSDAGEGPKDPFAGLLPAADGETGGRGLWIAHQACSHVSGERTDDGFTLRLIAGNPH